MAGRGEVASASGPAGARLELGQDRKLVPMLLGASSANQVQDLGTEPLRSSQV